MTLKDREFLQKAVGIIEGVSFCVSKEAGDALFCAVDIINEFLDRDVISDDN